MTLTNCTAESPEFFQLENSSKTRLEMDSNRRSCDLFSKEIMQFCTGEEGCPLPSWLEQCFGSILRCKPLIFRLHGRREHPKGSNCQVETPLEFSFSFSCIQLRKFQSLLTSPSSGSTESSPSSEFKVIATDGYDDGTNL